MQSTRAAAATGLSALPTSSSRRRTPIAPTRRASDRGRRRRAPSPTPSSQAATTAKSKLAPARVGYGTTHVDLNVNRDLFNSKLEWRQEPNPNGPSDKTLAVVEFLGADNVPIAVYMNYAMHPINFYLSGVVSADFPGEASRYIEELFDNRTIAVFSQGASGDQNPRDFRSPTTFMGQRAALTPVADRSIRRSAHDPGAGERLAARIQRAAGVQRAAGHSGREPGCLQEDDRAYRRVRPHAGNDDRLECGASHARIDSAYRHRTDLDRPDETFSCPGRVRNDADNPARENVFPGYKDGPDVTLKVGVLRLGEIVFAWVNGEVYSQIGMRLKAEAPASKTLMVTLANGSAGSGYIYSDEAYSHLTFQVIGSRLKPGCAEAKIVSTAVDLMRRY